MRLLGGWLQRMQLAGTPAVPGTLQAFWHSCTGPLGRAGGAQLRLHLPWTLPQKQEGWECLVLGMSQMQQLWHCHCHKSSMLRLLAMQPFAAQKQGAAA